MVPVCNSYRSVELEVRRFISSSFTEVRRSQRIMQRPHKGPITRINIDLTEDGEEPMKEKVGDQKMKEIQVSGAGDPKKKETVLKHGGTMKEFIPPKQHGKGIHQKEGKLYVSHSGLKTAMDKLKKGSK